VQDHDRSRSRGRDPECWDQAAADVDARVTAPLGLLRGADHAGLTDRDDDRRRRYFIEAEVSTSSQSTSRMSIGVVASNFSLRSGATDPNGCIARKAFAQPPQNLSSARFTAPQLLQPPGNPLPQPPQ
jgi:hypothetical protein